MVYKASFHNGHGNPQHNDRTCRQDKMTHVDHERTEDNIYWHNYMKRPGKLSSTMSFKEAEKKWYGANFKDWIQSTNDAADKSRHKERRTSASKLLSHRWYRPEETILQIGDIYNFPEDPKILQECFLELMNYRHKLVGRHCKMLDFAIHYDESTPHVHERHTWIYKDEDTGQLRIGQEKALKDAGIELPHPDEPVSNLNNRKITYDQMMREEWYNILERHGLEIDRTVNPEHPKHKSKQRFVEGIWDDRDRAERLREQADISKN